MATCPEAISTVVAPMRLPNWAFGVRRDRLVVLGDEVPGRQGLPGGDAHDVTERGQCQRLLHRVHYLRRGRLDVAGEVMDEVVLAQPAEPLLVGDHVLQRRGHRAGRQQAADRLTLVEPEGRHVDQPGGVRRVGAEGGHDLAAVGVARHDRGAVLQVQHLT